MHKAILYYYSDNTDNFWPTGCTQSEIIGIDLILTIQISMELVFARRLQEMEDTLKEKVFLECDVSVTSANETHFFITPVNSLLGVDTQAIKLENATGVA